MASGFLFRKFWELEMGLVYFWDSFILSTFNIL